MPDKREKTKSRYTADRGIPGAYEGETVTRRRFMVGTTHLAGAVPRWRSRCPRSPSRSARCSSASGPLVGRRPAGDFNPRHLRAREHHEHARASASRQDHRLRPPVQPGDRRRPAAARPVRGLHRDLHALRAPGLPGPLRRRRRSASSARATAASTTSSARSTAARRSGRWTASTPASRPAACSSARATRSTRELQPLLAPRPRRAAGRHRPVPVPGALLDRPKP